VLTNPNKPYTNLENYSMTQPALFNFDNHNPAKPFLKWAGGKTQLLPQFSPFIPRRFNNYFEPFTGSAAVYWYLYNLRSQGQLNFDKVTLMDINDELMTSYRVIRDQVDDLIVALRKHKFNHNNEYFYKVRALVTANLTEIDVAARFIYLNKTCFNGLYRVNSKGQFNVPVGKYLNPTIVNEQELIAASYALKSVDITTSSYEKIVDQAKKGDFVYFDPPYAPISPTSSFTSYTKFSFGETEQVKLSRVFRQLNENGCFLMLSNSWIDLTLSLYKGFKCVELKASRFINSNPDKRGKVSELLVMNYESPN
jgi:DNA adenine methylase